MHRVHEEVPLIRGNPSRDMGYEFTSDEEIDAFNHEDKAMDLTGYVDMIDGLKSLKTSQGHVLKFVLNNAAKSGIRVLIWSTALALKYEPSIRLNTIIEITRGSLKTSNPQFRIPNEKVSILEFHVQSHSVLKFHGEYKGNLISEPTVLFQNIRFDDVMIADGPIEIEGYIKSDGFCEVKTVNASYGQGLIADGHCRLSVQIACFKKDSRLQKGVHVKLRGVMNKQVGGGLRVPDMNSIDILEDGLMSLTDLKKSMHNLMMMKTKRCLEDSIEETAKRTVPSGNEENQLSN